MKPIEEGEKDSECVKYGEGVCSYDVLFSIYCFVSHGVFDVRYSFDDLFFEHQSLATNLRQHGE